MSSSSETEIWLCLHFRYLPLEVYTHGLGDADHERPMVVTEKHRVIVMNDAARQAGIVAGNSMETARTLCESVVSFERDTDREHRCLCQLAQWAYQFTPAVSIRSPDCLLLEVSGCLRLFGGLETLKNRIVDGLLALGYQTVIGINTTPLAAVCHASSGAPDHFGTPADSLSGLPVEHLQVEAAVLEKLRQLGIGQIGQIDALPTASLNRRFGVFFTDYLARLMGHKPDPQKFISEEPRFHSELNFLEDVGNLNGLVFPMRRLLAELEGFLTGRQLRASQLTWRISHRAHPACCFSVHLTHAEHREAVFLPLSQLRLEQVSDIPEADCLSLSVSRFEPWEAPSADLFEGSHFRLKDGRVTRLDERAEAMQLLDMFQARLGTDVCFKLSLGNDHRPEKAWRRLRPDERPSGQVETGFEENPRPVFLLGTPRLLRQNNGQPVLGGNLEFLQGPERIDFGWWDEQAAARDYYIVRHQTGALYWIYGQQERWFIHGIFA